MKKLVLVAIVVAAAGWLAYAKLRPAPKRACAHLHDLCGAQSSDADDDANDCPEFFDAIANNAGADAANKTASCVLEAKTCPEAAGCMAGGGIQLGTGAAKSFLDGLQKSMH